MRRKISLSLMVLVLILLIVPVLSANAQNNVGTIRGIVYNDLNADGYCVGTGEPGQQGVPVEFVYVASGTTVPLLTGVDGSYGIVSITLGTWRVTVKPPAGWRVTSQATREVTLTDTLPLATGIDFCITQAPASGGGTSPPVLPESGAGIAPGLIAAALMGASLLAAGTGVLLNSRRSSKR
ncbi:MAG TPA: SdrD B-like domain-containing protein [candidate division Zixibacteria bacterium]|nr:SdrD B-like domain-containing protein [candidate division Zixibacteria bacterium]